MFCSLQFFLSCLHSFNIYLIFLHFVGFFGSKILSWLLFFISFLYFFPTFSVIQWFSFFYFSIIISLFQFKSSISILYEIINSILFSIIYFYVMGLSSPCWLQGEISNRIFKPKSRCNCSSQKDDAPLNALRNENNILYKGSLRILTRSHCCLNEHFQTLCVFRFRYTYE